ncbi:MAG: DUF1801 domain-containing protein [Chloroflexi bacterium]|nr:DUF1801 domain-containing protein [Chloroflexota bacterium]MYK61936.1 DUF1801 domain-containing protein [Chloroflexota bacterium]
MQSKAKSVEDYLSDLDDTRREAISTVRDIVLDNLPDGYEEMMLFGMITYAVPLSIFPDTYNKQPLMYAALASQKRHMALYLTNVYGDGSLEEWFRERYKATGKRLDMGKSCVRFRKLDDLPLDLVGETIAMTPIDEFLEIYKASRTGTKRG